MENPNTCTGAIRRKKAIGFSRAAKRTSKAPGHEQEPPAPWVVGKVDPAWSSVRAKCTAVLKYSSGQSETWNGRKLHQALGKLKAGDTLRIGPGRWSIEAKVDLNLRGTKDGPIRIVALDPKQPPVITRPDERQNVLNIGTRSRTEYLSLENLELTGGSSLVRLYDCGNVRIDSCHLHHAGAGGITANVKDTDHLYITRNHLHHFVAPKANGESMYLGANNGKAVMSYSVIARNHVHDCRGRQGDGIEIKQGSHHNWIVENEVHDTNYPGIIVYGTAGNGVNRIERNTCYRSGDNVMQVQGEAEVYNNLLISGACGFASTDHQGKTRNLSFMHNTIITAGRGTNLTSWNDRAGMIFANNVVYSRDKSSVRFPNGSKGVVVTGNVVFGTVKGANRNGFTMGRGLKDFTDIDWDGTKRNAIPNLSGKIRGGDRKYTLETDLRGKKRSGRSVTPGAFECGR